MSETPLCCHFKPTGGRGRAHRSTTNQQSAGYLGPTGFCLFAKANMGCESHIKQSKWGVCQSSDSSLWTWSFLFFSTSRKSSWKNTSERYSDIQSQSWNRERKDIRQMLLQITSCFTHSSLTGESATTLKEKENPFSLWQSESVALSLPGMPRISFHYLSSPNHKHGDAEQLTRQGYQLSEPARASPLQPSACSHKTGRERSMRLIPNTDRFMQQSFQTRGQIITLTIKKTKPRMDPPNITTCIPPYSRVQSVRHKWMRSINETCTRAK